ncbi:MAG: hypothetical protein IAE91_07805 [Ignavibacteriaceae bacterium]|nr:hypothetical protein [Ignavibacteriaceae bacterium]
MNFPKLNEENSVYKLNLGDIWIDHSKKESYIKTDKGAVKIGILEEKSYNIPLVFAAVVTINSEAVNTEVKINTMGIAGGFTYNNTGIVELISNLTTGSEIISILNNTPDEECIFGVEYLPGEKSWVVSCKIFDNVEGNFIPYNGTFHFKAERW